MRKPSNPFIVTGYISPSYFCDREEELVWLNDQFVNERNAVLYSLRRMGKTALIRHFFYHLKKEFKIEGVHVDLLGTTNLTEANTRIASAIVQQSGDFPRKIGARLMKLLSTIGATIGVDPLSGTPQITFGLVKGQAIPKSLEAIGSYLQESDKPVVICIDEFQQVVSYSEKDAEATFRTWMQNFPMIRFIFCGSHRRMMTSMFSEKSRPFYRSAQMRELLPLPQKAYAVYINAHFRKAGKSIDSLHIESIFHWTRMQTYYVQLICNNLYGKTDHVDEETMKDVFSEIILQEVPLFSSYQRLLTSTQWKLLIALAREEETENPYAHGFLLEHGLGAASSVNAAMQTLIKKEFVICHNSKYVLHDTLLMRWLQQL